jgi:hypothetical protein
MSRYEDNLYPEDPDDLPLDDRLQNALEDWESLSWWRKLVYWLVTLW